MSVEKAEIALFGGSGKTGQAVIGEAVKRDIGLNGLVRRQGSLEATDPTVQEICGSLESQTDIERTLSGTSAIIITFGPLPPFQDCFCTQATRSIIETAKDQDISHLVCVTGAMIGEYPNNRTVAFEMLGRLVTRNIRESMADRALQEQLVIDSGLEWSLVKPPRLTEEAATGRIIFGPDVKAGMMSSLSRGDLAVHLLDLALGLEAGGLQFVKNA